MSRVLLRAIKRLTSWEKTPEEFVEMELMNGAEVDLNISVYLIDDEPPAILRTLSEHWASTKSPTPHNPCRAIDGAGKHAGIIEDKPGTGCFQHTRECHREIRFMRDAEVLEFARILMHDRDARTRSVARDQVRRYMAERFVANDGEWKQLGMSKPQWREWAVKPTKASVVNAQASNDVTAVHASGGNGSPGGIDSGQTCLNRSSNLQEESSSGSR